MNSLTRFGLAFFVCATTLTATHAQFTTPTIVLDYTYDTNNFFGSVGSPQRLALQAAATRIQARLADTLTAITPGSGNTWTANFAHPGTGSNQNISNLSIATNEIRVFAGGRNLGGSTLGQGGFGGWSGVGSTAFFNSIARGQYDPGAPASTVTDFGAWGGAITFNTTSSWNFSVASGPSGSQNDFLSVAEHELGHLMGIGTADSWDNLITGTTYNGLVAGALVSGLTTTADKGHWAAGTQYLGVEAGMTPSIVVGTRKLLNELDFAGLDDLGWQVNPVPEPGTIMGIVAVGGLAWYRLRRTTRQSL